MIKKILKNILIPIKSFFNNPNYRLRLKYAYYRDRKKINEKTILYEAYHGRSMTCNPYAIFKQLLEKFEFSDFKHIWVLNDLNDPNVSKYSNNKNIEFVALNSREYLKYLATAKYLINNTTFPSYFNKRLEQVYINTWHGTPLKHMGKDIAKADFAHHKNIQRNLLHCDYIVMPNQFTTENLLDSHDVLTILPGKIINEGYPRNDLLFKASSFVRDTLKISSTKKIILYAPTWRGTGENREINTTEQLQNDVKEIQKSVGDSYEILLKVHPFIYKYLKNEMNLNVNLVPDWIDTNELMSIVDVLITDYSSIFFDFLPRKKPILFYVYDWESYKKDRGFYLDLNTLPGPLCYTLQELIANIINVESVKDKYENRLKEYKDKYCTKDDGNVTNRIVDIIFKNDSNFNVYSVQDNRKKILIYPGGFENNGITSSINNLLNNIDYSKYNITLILNDKYKEIELGNVQKINPRANKLYRLGTFNFRFFEHYSHLIVSKLSKYAFFRQFYCTKVYKDEFHRVFGDVVFDNAINFSGYSELWTQLFAFNSFKKKSIFLHNDMLAESQKSKHKKRFEVIFPLYEYFDKIASVSSTTREINESNLSPYISGISNKMITVTNSIDYQAISEKAKQFSNVKIGNVVYHAISINHNNRTVSFKGVSLPDDNTISFVTMGRFSVEKDHIKLINAFYEVNSEFPNTKLFIIGDGPLKKELISQINKLSLSEQVILTGQLENPFPIINKCDCFVLSSNYEGQPMVLLETMVLGKPIISTDIPGSRFVLEDGYGLLVENSVQGLVKGMKEFVEKNIKFNSFDYISYNKKTMENFYKEIC
ncbi:glycosyltransferase [Paenibacillus sp. M1]|uniref:Glycosyltransferase n=1 Tax=Paenibacillus haidiansis TaxID=1574488 RepID=A0ABU7VXD2_9BACL